MTVKEVYEAITQLKAEGKLCELQCLHCEQRYREDCISKQLQLLKAQVNNAHL